MPPTPLIIANWKMNLTFQEVIKYSKFFQNLLYDNKISKNLLLAPPAIFLSYLTANFPDLQFCSQDISMFNNNGPYSGEISASMVSSCNVNHTIIGHYERRHHFNETNNIICKKVHNALENNLIPIICIGEDIHIKNNNKIHIWLKKQIHATIPKEYFETHHNQEIIIAYEPIWAIGTGTAPSLMEISQIFEYITELILSDKNLKLVAKNIRLIYGGSVSSKNHKEILAINNIEGLLVGSASLKAEEIQKILT